MADGPRRRPRRRRRASRPRLRAPQSPGPLPAPRAVVGPLTATAPASVPRALVRREKSASGGPLAPRPRPSALLFTIIKIHLLCQLSFVERDQIVSTFSRLNVGLK